jgi:hypothetical protein
LIGIIKSAMGFTRFHQRGLKNVAAEWLLTAPAYNCRRLYRLQQARAGPPPPILQSEYANRMVMNPTGC